VCARVHVCVRACVYIYLCMCVYMYVCVSAQVSLPMEHWNAEWDDMVRTGGNQTYLQSLYCIYTMNMM